MILFTCNQFYQNKLYRYKYHYKNCLKKWKKNGIYLKFFKTYCVIKSQFRESLLKHENVYMELHCFYINTSSYLRHYFRSILLKISAGKKRSIYWVSTISADVWTITGKSYYKSCWEKMGSWKHGSPRPYEKIQMYASWA